MVTPGAGYQVDPNNPNAVIPIGSSAQSQGLGVYSTPAASTVSPAPQASTPAAPAPYVNPNAGFQNNVQAPTQQPAAQPAQQQTPSAPSVVINNGTQSSAQSPTTQSTQSQAQPTVQPPSTSLQPGATGQDVQALQNYLVQMGYLTPQQVASGPGIYGPQTTAAVAKMQQDLGVNAGNAQGFYGPQTQQALAQKYQNLFGAVKGSQVPNDGGAARTALDGMLSQQSQDSTNPVFGALTGSMDPIMQSLTQVLQNINNPALTATSLQSEYNTLRDQYNLPQMQASMMNMQNIMNGTESDIRDEITTAGGPVTDSQVQAMAAARNKVILKQYNALSTQYDAAQNNVQAMMQYAQTDQSNAMQREQMTAGIMSSLANIKMQQTQMGLTMVQHAQSNYQYMISNLGPQEFVNALGGNTASAEQILGFAPGKLSDPQFVQSLQTKWQQQLSMSAIKQYETLYGTLPPGWSYGSSGLPSYTGSGSSTSPGSSGYSGSTVVGGIDFGNTASGVGAYATDIQSEVTGVGNAYNTITGAYGTDPSANQLSQYIYSASPNSPITGQMITSAADSYGVSPAILAATLNNESAFGTAGVGAKTFNPGNVGNTGTSTQNMGSWQAGVNATAQQLARRQVGIDPNLLNSPNYTTALKLATYQMAPSQVSKKGTTYNQITSLADQISKNMGKGGYDPSQAQIWYDYAGQQGTINTLNYLGALVGTNNSTGNLQSLVNISDGISRTNFPALNNVNAWKKLQTGDPQMASYFAAATEVADQVGKILQGGGTGSGTSDAKLAQANGLFDTGFSGAQIKAVASTLQTLLANRASSIIGNNPLLLKQADALGLNAGAETTMIAPDGTQGTVPQNMVQSLIQQGYKVQ